jgi:hypothetical protein
MTHLAASAVVDVALQLMRAGRWGTATTLLTAARPEDRAEQLTLALARAELAADQDFWQQTDHWPAAFAEAEPLLDGEPSWDLAFAEFRKDYATALFSGTGEAGDLRERSLRLIDTAPDDGRLAAISFWAGVLADNLLDEPEAAYAYYKQALPGDELVTSYALRHLGDHAHTAGDLVLAREYWEQSTELREKVGHVPGALAQQVLLAMLLRDEGDEAGARAVATETNRWARQLGITFIIQQTAELMG